jgi:PadR family transcriptional regulator
MEPQASVVPRGIPKNTRIRSSRSYRPFDFGKQVAETGREQPGCLLPAIPFLRRARGLPVAALDNGASRIHYLYIEFYQRHLGINTVKARNEALKGSLDLLILKTLDRRGPLHGYGIAVQIERVSADALRVEEGSLYPALHRLESTGWIRAEWGTSDNKRRARYYALTRTGRKRLEQEEAAWRQLTSAIGRVLRYV